VVRLRLSRLRLPRATQARLGCLAAAATVGIGSGMEWGTGIGLIVGGSLAGAYFLAVHDTDEPPRGQR
jgi:hypothetical protein